MRKTIVLLLFASVSLSAQPRRPQVNDGEMHGDPHYLIEDGWKPLLTGKDLTGWKGQTPDKNEWVTTTGVLWERLLGPTRLRPIPANAPGGTIVNGPTGRTVNLVTEEKFGDMELYVEFMLAKGSNSGVYLHGLYEVQVFDSWNSDEPVTSSDCGGIYHRWINEQGVGGSAPSKNASRPPGQWQSFYILFQAPKFDGGGKKSSNAKFLRVVHNGVTIQRDVEVDGPTRAAMNLQEATTNPLMLQGDHGPVAYRNIYWRPLRPVIDR